MNSYNLNTPGYNSDIKLERGVYMGNYYPPFSLRISEELIDKIKVIASKNKRSANKELEYIIEKYINEYEDTNGKIEINYINNDSTNQN